MKMIEALKSNTASMMIIAAMAWAFLVGVFAEKAFTNNRILDMQNECVKRRVADFYFAENGKIEFKWHNK